MNRSGTAGEHTRVQRGSGVGAGGVAFGELTPEGIETARKAAVVVAPLLKGSGAFQHPAILHACLIMSTTRPETAPKGNGLMKTPEIDGDSQPMPGRATERLYLQHDHCFEADASVVAVRENAVAFDRICFYPGGGGQPPDRGFMSDSINTKPSDLVAGRSLQ